MPTSEKNRLYKTMVDDLKSMRQIGCRMKTSGMSTNEEGALARQIEKIGKEMKDDDETTRTMTD